MTVSVLDSRKCENRDFGTARANWNSCVISQHFRLGHNEFYGKVFLPRFCLVTLPTTIRLVGGCLEESLSPQLC